MTGAKIITAPVWKRVMKGRVKNSTATAHEKDMEAFYRFQKDGASAFRSLLLKCFEGSFGMLT